ncbi:MAG TPA: M48 family metallopeptidase [Myxococcota bacterium]|nr:M48 family metallopeptidase [Myxococcota bacterium]
MGILLLAVLGGCARSLERPALSEQTLQSEDKQLLEEALSLMVERWSRVLAVSYRLRTAGVELCGAHVAPILGLIGARAIDLPTRFRETQLQMYGMSDQVVVLDVLPDSPAARAGVERRDKLVSVKGHAIRGYSDVVDALRDGDNTAVRVKIARNDNAMDLAVPVVLACSQDALLSFRGGLDVTVEKNHKDVAVSTDLLQFVQSDDELALAIARAMARSVIGKDTEDDGPKLPEADRLGLYLAARSGFETSSALAFWDRVALSRPTDVACIREGTEECKPPAGRYPDRAAEIQTTTLEIQEKRTKGEPLTP